MPGDAPGIAPVRQLERRAENLPDAEALRERLRDDRIRAGQNRHGETGVKQGADELPRFRIDVRAHILLEMQLGQRTHLLRRLPDELPELEQIELFDIERPGIVVVKIAVGLGEIALGRKVVPDGELFPADVAIVVDQRVIHVEKINGGSFHVREASSVSG